jgi:hypothetical protein
MHRSCAALRLAVLALAALAAAPAGAADDQVKDLEKKIQNALKAGKTQDVLAHAQALAAVKGEKAAEALFEIGLKAEAAEVFNGIAKHLAKMTDDGALGYFEKQSKGPDERTLVYLADVLSLMKHAKAAPILGNLTASKSEKVVSSAVASLSKLRVRACVQPLLDLLERLDKKKDRGLIYQEVRDALFEITDQDFDVVEDWKKWWDPVKDSFEPGKREDGKTQVVRKPRDEAPEFAGKKIFAKNVLFIIDTSGTMQYVMKDDIPGLSVADGSDSAGQVQKPKEQITPENERLARFWTRMEMAKRELVKALNGFGAGARFNVLEFNKAAKLFAKALIDVSPKVKKDYTARIKNMQWVQVPGTNTLKAIEEAFKSDSRVNAMYFLSDGLPSADGKKNDDPLPLLDKVEALNRFRKVKVHTFGYDPVSITTGEPHPELVRANEFLKKLAERTGGSFTLLKVTDEKPPADFK